MARSDLPRQAQRFAAQIQQLLNGTVAQGTHISFGQPSGSGVIAVGAGLSARRHEVRPVALLAADVAHPLYLDVQYRLSLDEEGRHLMVWSSFFGVKASAEAADPFFHYDYERGKAGYAEAHLQIHGENAEFQRTMRALCTNRKKKQLGGLHFPVGGRRFRPALEDVIEFLVDEQLVRPREGWRGELDRSRRDFREIQLRAAVRREPEVARQALADLAR